jgi:hypothetical protein
MRARHQQRTGDLAKTCDSMVAITTITGASRDQPVESKSMKVCFTLCSIVAAAAGFRVLNANSLVGTNILTDVAPLLRISKLKLEDNVQCRFFLAESAIPRGGLGVYTASDIKAGELAQSMPDVCIYVADTPEGTAFHTHSWARDVFHGTFEGRNPRAACEGFATL